MLKPWVVIYGVCMVWTMVACTGKNNRGGDSVPIATAYDNVLYKKDLAGIGAHAAKKEDSVLAVKKYVEAWLHHQVVLHTAGENISTEAQAQIDNQLKDYRESLVIYGYEKELINQKMDTTVTQKDIQDYFSKYKDNFTLKSSIVQVKYLIVPKAVWDKKEVPQDTVRKWLRQKPNTYNYPAQVYAAKYASGSALNDTAWYAVEELRKVFPMDIVPIDNWAYGHDYHEVADNKYVYLIQFTDNRLKGGDAPLGYVYKQIRSIILNKRKVAFIENIHSTIYEQAKSNGKIENYITK